MFKKLTILILLAQLSTKSIAQEGLKIYKSSISFSKVTSEGLKKCNELSDEMKTKSSVSIGKVVTQKEFDQLCKALPWISELSITFNTKIKNINSVSNLKQLKSLSLNTVTQSSNRAFSLKPLRKCNALEKLWVIGTILKDGKSLGATTKLKKVVLRYSEIDDIGFLASQKDLREVMIEETESTFKDFSPLSSLRNLKKLELSGLPQASDASLIGLNGKLNNLELLSFEKNSNITNLDFLSSCTKLKKLVLQDLTKLTSISVVKKLTALEDLGIENAPISSINGLERCLHLIDLSIEKCPIQDLSPLSQLKKIEYISLQETKVVDITPLFGLKSLTDLEIESGVPAVQVKKIESKIKDLSVEQE